MKRLLLAAVAAFAFISSAQAAPVMPKEYRGAWCPGAVYFTPEKKTPARYCEQEGVVMLTATEWIAGEEERYACQLTEIKSVIIGKINLPEGIFTCPEGHQIRFVITTGSGSNGAKSRRLYVEDR